MSDLTYRLREVLGTPLGKEAADTILAMIALIEQQHDALLGESRVQNRWSDAMIEALTAYEEFNK